MDISKEIERLKLVLVKRQDGIKTDELHRVEQLLAIIRAQPDYLTQLRIAYITTVQLFLNFAYFDTEYERAILEGERLLTEIDEDDSLVFIALLNSLSINYIRLGDCQNSLKSLHCAYSLMLTYDGDEEDTPLCRIAMNIGLTFFRLKDLEQAIEWALKALTIAQQSNRLDFIQTITSNLCVIYTEQGCYEQAVQYGEQSLRVLETHGTGRGRIYNHLANVWFALSDIEKSEQYHRQGLTYYQENDQKIGVLSALQGLGQIAIKRKQYDEGISFLEKATHIAEGTKSNLVMYENYELLADAHFQAGNYEESLRYHKRFHEAYTVVYDQKKQESLHQLEIKHQTEIIQIEAQKLRIKNEELEQVVAERTADVLTALEQSERANIVRSNMLKTIMHEFRTPLTVISSSSGLLKKHAAKMSPEKKEQMHGRITESTQYLSHLLAEVSKVDNVTGNLEPNFSSVIVGQWSEKLCKSLERQIEYAPNVTFVFDAADETTIEIDKKMTKAIVSELLINAVKYTLDDKPITVEVGVDHGELVITVADEGMGIAADEIDKIYELFYRAYKAGDIPGLGAGLYVVVAMVTALGGEINVQSDGIGFGTVFSLKLPDSPK